ncbi:MAG TPA: pseudouridine synthase, partial [Candidatus Aenigmarchaeota archaeon]|nr:pseudouridine synthase [Candidatus Aenigmarchaeota archaeon]
VEGEIIPREEVIVLSSDSELLGVGEAVLSSEEMRLLKRGVAVKVREGAYRSKTMEA